MTTTADTLVPQQLWQTIQPLLPTPPRRYGGRPRIDDRAALAGIVYQLRTGVPWRLLPVRELGCGSPVTCWRRLRDWQRAGVWQQLHHLLLEQLSRNSRLDWSRASLDSISVRAKRGAARLGRTRQTAASQDPSTTCWSTATRPRWRRACQRPTPMTRGCSSRSSTRSRRSRGHAAVPIGRARVRSSSTWIKANDDPRCRRALPRRGIMPRIARRGIDSSQRLGRHR
jgi:transposase